MQDTSTRILKGQVFVPAEDSRDPGEEYEQVVAEGLRRRSSDSRYQYLAFEASELSE